MKDEIQEWVLENNLDPIRPTILVDRPGKTVAKVETTRRKLVLKAPVDPREVAANERLAAAGLPVSRIVARRDRYLLMEWIDGERLSSASPPSVQLQAGRLLRKVHDLGGGPPYKGNATWPDWMRGWLNHALHEWEPGPSQVRKVGAGSTS